MTREELELAATATREELINFLSKDVEADLTQYGKDGWGSLESSSKRFERAT